MKRVIVLAAFLLATIASVRADTESVYQEWSDAVTRQKYPEALALGMALFHASQSLPQWDSCEMETSPEDFFLFDIGNTLIHLSRWEEAKFCLTLFLIHAESDEELAKTFGPEFSKVVWLRDNKIHDQPFFRDTLPKGEQNSDGNPIPQ